MIPRTIKRYSSGSNAASVSARAGIRSLIMTSADQQPGGNNIQEASYATKTFEDGDASPLSGTPLSSRRSSLASNANAHPVARGRRGSSLLASSPLSSTPTPTDSSVSTPASARAFSTTAPTLASDEHGAYQFTPKELAAVQKRVEEEFALKSVVSSTKSSSSRSSSPTRSGAGSLLQPRRPSTKVPYEASSTDGLTRHPSGFVVPSPGPAPSTLATDGRVRPPGVSSAHGVKEGVASYKDLSERATAGQWTRSEKVPQEVRVQGIGGERVQHPSGFVPPTPQHDAMRTIKEVYKPAVDLANASNA